MIRQEKRALRDNLLDSIKLLAVEAIRTAPASLDQWALEQLRRAAEGESTSWDFPSLPFKRGGNEATVYVRLTSESYDVVKDSSGDLYTQHAIVASVGWSSHAGPGASSAVLAMFLVDVARFAADLEAAAPTKIWSLVRTAAQVVEEEEKLKREKARLDVWKFLDEKFRLLNMRVGSKRSFGSHAAGALVDGEYVVSENVKSTKTYSANVSQGGSIVEVERLS